MGEHPFVCPNEKTMESHGRQISELFEQGRDREARMTEMETVLWGAERNGGGFIKDTKETMEIVRVGLGTLSTQVKELCDSKAGKRSMWEKALPAIIGLASAVAVAVVTKAL